ncbi:MAG TPA: hypothetical protein PKM39_10175, partial [Pseudothauera hydrothermalis]|nr:hypothetical protein [Pseudothauera hydrothermalis]
MSADLFFVPGAIAGGLFSAFRCRGFGLGALRSALRILLCACCVGLGLSPGGLGSALLAHGLGRRVNRGWLRRAG